MIIKHLAALIVPLILASSAIPRLDCNTDALAELLAERAEIVGRIDLGGNYLPMLADWDNANSQTLSYLDKSVRDCFKY